MCNGKVKEKQKLKMTVGFLLGPRPCGRAVLRGVWLARYRSQEEREGSSGAWGTAGCVMLPPTIPVGQSATRHSRNMGTCGLAETFHFTCEGREQSTEPLV